MGEKRPRPLPTNVALWTQADYAEHDRRMGTEQEPKITKYDGDEGRDRMKNPSINAPHTAREAFLAVLRDVEVHGMSRVEGRTFHAGGPSQRSEIQAFWLNEAQAKVTEALNKVLEDMRAEAGS